MWGNSLTRLILSCSRFSIYPSLALCVSLCALCLSEWKETSEGSGWLSLLEADGRPKARRPQFHEAWFEHARTMSRGMPVDDGCIVCVCMYVCERAFGGRWLIFVGYQFGKWDPHITVCQLFLQKSSVHFYALVRQHLKNYCTSDFLVIWLL